MHIRFALAVTLGILVLTPAIGRSQTPPTISSFTPSSGPVGTAVTISGTAFAASPSNNIVYFGSVRGNVTAATSTSLTVTVPSGTSYAPISVTTGALTAYSRIPFDVTFATAGVFDTLSFTGPITFGTGLFPAAGLDVADLDGDGKPDIIVGNGGDATISLFRNISTPGSLTIASLDDSVNLTTGVQPYDVKIGDLDGDGKPDIVAIDRDFNSGTAFSVYRNTSSVGAISFAQKADFTTPTNPFSIALSDIDGDGKTDISIVSYGSDSIAVFRNLSTPGTIALAAPLYYSACGGLSSIAAGDLNGDGKPDLVIANGSCQSVSVLENTSTSGSISFAGAVGIPDPGVPNTAVLGDMNGDGRLDLIVTDFLNNNVTVLKNLNTGGAITTASFDNTLNFPVNLTPRIIAMGDLDGDGRPDILVGNHDSHIASILRNTSASGGISFAPKADFQTGQFPLGVTVADIDGDGRPDWGVINNGDESVSLHRNLLGDMYVLESVAGAHGTISPLGVASIRHQGDTSYTIAADTGYFVKDIFVDSVSVGPSGVYHFTHVRRNHLINATFAIDTFIVTATAGAHGAIFPSGSVPVTFGSNQSFTITPDTGYHVDSVFIDGTYAGSGTSASLTNVRAAHTVHVKFEVDIHTITSSYGAHGHIAPQGAVPVPHGATQGFTMIPDSGFVVENVLVDGGSVGAPSLYTFSNVKTDHTIHATFASYVLTLSPSSIPFGSAHVESTLSANVILANHGTGTITLDSVRSDEAEFSGLPLGSAIAPGESLVVVVSFHPLSTGYKSSHIIFYHQRIPIPDTVNVSGTAFLSKIQSVASQWNLISLPVEPADRAKSSVYPSAISQAFSFKGTYHPADTLSTGHGYWLKFPSPVDVGIDGATIASDSIGVSPGWNLIGSLTAKIAASSVVQIGTSIRSPLFRYQGAYITSDSISPGSGYWVKVDNAGILYLSSAPSVIVPKSAARPKGSGLNDGLNSITVQDLMGSSQTLYFGGRDGGPNSPDQYELPPVPPQGSFDARFSNQSLLAVADAKGGGDTPLLVASPAFPVRISWSMKDVSEATMKVGTKRVTLRQTGAVTVENPETAIRLEWSAAPAKPTSFSLAQNYPNPFNPSTKIVYSLPEDATVRLEIFNVLGQQVAQLVNGNIEAGIHTAEFDASGIPGGVYFYRIQAQRGGGGETIFSQVRKMLLMK